MLGASIYCSSFFFCLPPPPPISTLFPYTTLFRSHEERARIDAERLARENSRRAAKNLPPLKSVEELEKTKDKDEVADVVLEQATQVMADMVSGAHTPPQTKTARTSG